MKNLGTFLLFGLFTVFLPVKANTYLTITAIQADTLIKNHQVGVDLIILDVRTATEYISERIPNSQNLDYYKTWFSDTLSKLDKTKIYLLYCASGARSNATMNKMRNLNFKKVYNLSGGLPAWKSAGLPTVKGGGTGIEPEEEIIAAVKLFPNPASETAWLELSGFVEEELRVQVMNVAGSMICEKRVEGNGLVALPVTEFTSGVYFYRILARNKTVRNGKFHVFH